MTKNKYAAKAALGVCLAAAGAAVFIACDERLCEKHYSLTSPRISSRIKAAFISDLHNTRYGRQQHRLTDKINANSPDIIIFGGDMTDAHDAGMKNACDLVKHLAGKYPCFYTIGNHESRRGDSKLIKHAFAKLGVTVLEGSAEKITVNGSDIEICGIYDSFTYDERDGVLINQLSAVTDNESGCFRILAAHFPSQIDNYMCGGFDLVLSGHAHGGQWRIPGLLNGLYSPDEGLFPKHAGGIYTFEPANGRKTVHIVSRGLCRCTKPIPVPRIFNRPELVFVDLLPENADNGN